MKIAGKFFKSRLIHYLGLGLALIAVFVIACAGSTWGGLYRLQEKRIPHHDA
jgi:hypothetical protein